MKDYQSLLDAEMARVKAYLVHTDAQCSDVEGTAKRMRQLAESRVALEPGVQRVREAVEYLFGGSLKV